MKIEIVFRPVDGPTQVLFADLSQTEIDDIQRSIDAPNAEDIVLHIPYAQDLDGVWHRRPAGDSWNSDYSATQCRTVCGQAIYSVRASEYTPEPDRSLDESLCQTCFVAQPEYAR